MPLVSKMPLTQDHTCVRGITMSRQKALPLCLDTHHIPWEKCHRRTVAISADISAASDCPIPRFAFYSIAEVSRKDSGNLAEKLIRSCESPFAH